MTKRMKFSEKTIANQLEIKLVGNIIDVILKEVYYDDV